MQVEVCKTGDCLDFAFVDSLKSRQSIQLQRGDILGYGGGRLVIGLLLEADTFS